MTFLCLGKYFVGTHEFYGYFTLKNHQIIGRFALHIT